ncbi:MAG TPA: glycosyl hydrolase [Actinocrinis sp.]|uniref:glycoside hydrolase family 26 protein n=1 Tax=Actinocrinis sp. TaxID=1920516 RepID=UPI002DDD17E3|nr:glycosyl hydrolase [Actinocrinis sp.]HEV2343568.1 glycosyl hydrolase [Actinocrinis sp.]
MSSRAAPKRHRQSRGRLQVWMTVNVLVLAALLFGLGKMAATSSARTRAKNAAAELAVPASPGAGASASAKPKPSAGTTPAIPTAQQVMALPGKYYGLSAPGVPWSQSTVDKYTLLAGGVAPNMAEYFLNWQQDFDPATAMDAYSRAELPLLSWEPWAGGNADLAKATGQPQYSLGTIVDGAHDAYITKFAEAVRDNRWPIAIRFAHEMNGNWYSWSERVNHNSQGQFVEAWRHVHDIFARVGAANVIWVWSPNVIRHFEDISLAELYPGDAYVDWVGVTAYEVTEQTTAQLLDPTMNEIRQFTRKPMLITETGGQPNRYKASWTAEMLSWLPKQPDVVGFVWFEYDGVTGGRTDWTFEGDPQTLQSFKSGISRYPMVRVPIPGAS